MAAQTPHERLPGPVVANPRNQRIREYAGLSRRSARSKARRFLAEGPQTVREALRGDDAAGLVTDLLVTPEAADRHQDILDAAAEHGLVPRAVTPEVLAALTDTVTSQGLVAVCRFLDVPLQQAVDAGRDGFVVMLAQVRDPGNAGTVIRAADAAGAAAVILSSGSVDLYNAKTVRASAGSHFHLPLSIGAGLAETTEALRGAGYRIWAADVHPPAADLHALDPDALTPGHAWLFGNEAWGLPAEDRALADGAIAVPIYGAAESLNLGTAAAVCLYESARALRSGK
ncbi:TrmH family RNA methyltransferase [Sediminivirga luteola]|uniref:RNA methyltransferase n=1 Tax=Sediminivirga luteola TaxID=1774748 RepID=A0A8J2XLQ9_9MICO|nr:RNA methyltransferase [Sediminivirga luteola]MCI2265325.1 RNA methyltransferase [Sediminivirga luteola]GGA24833.1 RNA methyltransferase [Sediminivirga luteola]